MFSRIANGWKMAIISLKVLGRNKSLLVFPLLSALCSGLLAAAWFCSFSVPAVQLRVLSLVISCLFLYAIYFTIIFFNIALIHCVRLYALGNKVTVSQALQFSSSRVRMILYWVLFSLFVGTFINFMRDRSSFFGRFAGGDRSLAWNVATFFVLPVLACENVSPVEAVERSAKMVKERYGEALSANFSIGLMLVLAVVPLYVVAMGVSELINEQAGIVMFVAITVLAVILTGTLNNIFVSLLYMHGDKSSKHIIDLPVEIFTAD